YKIHPHARRDPKALAVLPGISDLCAVQLVADDQANAAALKAIDKLKAAPIQNSFRTLGYLNIIVRLPSDKLDELSKQPDIVSIQPYTPRRLFDERQDVIVAGNLTGNLPSGPG